MLISDIAIRRPVFTTMVVIGLMTLGLLGASSLGIDLFPDVDFPVMNIATVYPGAGPEEVEQLVSKPIEEATSSINGIDEVRSYSRDSMSQVVLLFKLETEIKAAAVDVREKVSAIRSKLPLDIHEPVIARMDPSAIPILTFAVSSNRGPAETRRLTEDVIEPKLEAVDGVASVVVSGGLERELHIWVDRSRMEALGLSLAQISQQIGADSFDLPGGRITQGGNELNVRTLGRFRTVEELGEVAVATTADGSQVKLKDVARVDDGYKEVRTKPLADGKQAVTFDIQKQSGSNTVAIADAVYKRLADVKKVLPADLKVVNVIDTSTFIRRNYDDVKDSILWGGAMAVMVVFLFMLDWRSTIITSLSLPTSVVTTFLAMKLLNFNFNMMSMMGLSLSIGLLIDDAVVVRENIFRHMERGEDPVTAAQRGTAQIGLAVMATTFTIVAVFVPVAFTGGMIGKMFRQFGLTVAAAVIVSLFVSFTLDPMMSARVVKPIKPGHHEAQKRHPVFGPIIRTYDALDVYYRGLLAWALGHKKTVVFAAVVFFAGALALLPIMGTEFMSSGDRGEFLVNLEAPAGTSFEQMEKITANAEATLRRSTHVKTLFTTVAPNEEANKALIHVYTDKKAERPNVPIAAVQQEVRGLMASIPSIVFQLVEPNFMGAADPQNRPIYLQIRGENYETLQRLAQQAVEIVRNTRGTTDADMSYRPGKPETSISVDRARAADLGVSVGMVAQTVRLALEGEVVAKYRQADRDWDIRLQLAPEDRRDTAMLGNLVVPVTLRKLNAGPAAAAVRAVRINEVADVRGSTGPTTIEQFARQRQILVTAGVAGRSMGEIISEVEGKLAKLDKPAGYVFEFGGQAKNMRDTFSNLGVAVLVAILFIYFVLASQFESFIHPFTIMAALPLALIGAIILLFMSGFPISMIALIGIILLMGLVTKNSILLVDLTNELRAKGKTITEALLEAGPTRLRPILMTSAAMVLGMMPSALSRGEGAEMRVPMALAVIGGVITSTFLTLIVVPVVYTWLDHLTLKHKSTATADHYREELAEIGEAVAEPAAVVAVSTIQREAKA